ncbi:TPA: hypothetical protein NIH23_003089 [Pseudomonas aeruginosa]|nr:hypothetical protein [Pseudomonas aeruginosa]
MLSIPWAVVAFFVLSHAKYNPVAHELLKLLDCSSWLKSQQGEGPQLADCCQSSLDLREPQALEIAMQLNGERWHIANKIPFPATVVLSLLSAPDLAEKPAP